MLLQLATFHLAWGCTYAPTLCVEINAICREYVILLPAGCVGTHTQSLFW